MICLSRYGFKLIPKLHPVTSIMCSRSQARELRRVQIQPLFPSISHAKNRIAIRERGNHLFVRYSAFKGPLQKFAHSHTRPILVSGLSGLPTTRNTHTLELRTFHPFTHNHSATISCNRARGQPLLPEDAVKAKHSYGIVTVEEKMGRLTLSKFLFVVGAGLRITVRNLSERSRV